MAYKVTQDDVAKVIKEQVFLDVGEKTCVCLTTLVNGFEIVTSSSCVDPEHYSHKVGMDICKKRAEDKVWALLGFLCQQDMYEAENKSVVQELFAYLGTHQKLAQQKAQDILNKENLAPMQHEELTAIIELKIAEALAKHGHVSLGSNCN